jgi:hypothetical protein
VTVAAAHLLESIRRQYLVTKSRNLLTIAVFLSASVVVLLANFLLLAIVLLLASVSLLASVLLVSVSLSVASVLSLDRAVEFAYSAVHSAITAKNLEKIVKRNDSVLRVIVESNALVSTQKRNAHYDQTRYHRILVSKKIRRQKKRKREEIETKKTLVKAIMKKMSKNHEISSAGIACFVNRVCKII